jgi:hypothetical protein
MKQLNSISFYLLGLNLIAVLVTATFIFYKLPEHKDVQMKAAIMQEKIANLDAIHEQALSAARDIEKINQRAIGLDSKIVKNTSAVQIDSGRIKIDNTTFPDLSAPEGCKGKRGLLNQSVIFQRTFSSVPTVLVGISSVDFRFGQDNRLRAIVTDASEKDFKLDFYTWCDTKMSQAELNWIAIGD